MTVQEAAPLTKKEKAFFTTTICDRCNESLRVRTMSWFNDDVICMACSKKEDEIRAKLRKQGKDPNALEGCGYIPAV